MPVSSAGGYAAWATSSARSSYASSPTPGVRICRKRKFTPSTICRRLRKLARKSMTTPGRSAGEQAASWRTARRTLRAEMPRNRSIANRTRCLFDVAHFEQIRLSHPQDAYAFKIAFQRLMSCTRRPGPDEMRPKFFGW